MLPLKLTDEIKTTKAEGGAYQSKTLRPILGVLNTIRLYGIFSLTYRSEIS
jgi:hypothetical protein